MTEPKHRSLSSRLGSPLGHLALLATLAGGCLAEDSPDDQLDLEQTTTADEAIPEHELTAAQEPRDPPGQQEGDLIATLELAAPDAQGTRNTSIRFYAIGTDDNDDDGSPSVAVLEMIPPGGIALADIPELAGDVNAREVFHALAFDDTVEPAVLAESYAPAQLGPRGWARAQIANGTVLPSTEPVAAAACGWTSFANGFNAFHPEVNGTKYWYTAMSPYHDTVSDYYYSFDPNTWRHVYTSNGSTYPWNNQYQNYRFYNVDQFKSRVKVCNLESGGNELQTRQIVFRYRTSSDVAHVAAVVNLNPALHQGLTFQWQWTPAGNHNYDWVTLLVYDMVYPHTAPAADHYYYAVQKKG